MAPSSNAALADLQRGPLLGRGGMGSVYRGHLGGLPVAIKVLSQELTRNERIRKRFIYSASVLSRLDHPAIVKVHRVINRPDELGIVMELVQGPSLETVMRYERPGPWNQFEARAVMAPILRGMAVAHAEKLVHRDLKPSNVVLDRARGDDWPGRPVIIDFDLVKAPESEQHYQSREGARMGTYPYMPPEQFRGVQDVDSRADVFTLGMMMWELLAGRLPVRDPNDVEGEVADLYSGRMPIPRLDTLAPGVSRELVDAVQRALSLDPAGRQRDAAALLEEFRWPMRATEAPTLDPEPTPEPPPPPLPPRPPPPTPGDDTGGAGGTVVATSERGGLNLWFFAVVGTLIASFLLLALLC